MRRNLLRELLKADQPSLGTHVHSSWPSIVELIGHSRMFDYVEFVAEYARTTCTPWRTSAGRWTDVDMVQFGPADYSMSIGLAVQFSHPRVREAECYVIETALKLGIAPRAEINHPGEAQRYLDMGVKHFCIGTDVLILFQ